MGRAFNPDLLLQMPLMAVLSTLSPDGPRNAPVWYAWEEGALWMLGSTTSSSVKRLQSDPRCAVEILHYDNAGGVLAHLGLRGKARIEPDDPPRFRRLLRRYLDADPHKWNPWFIENIARIEEDTGRFIKLVPDSTFTNNVSYYRTGPEVSWP
ncbi:MAG: pyridoxamine 5'-phosphate oxidase family protein [Pseudomonadota bacterium]